VRAAIDMRIYGRRGIGRYNAQLHASINAYGTSRMDATFLGHKPEASAGRWQPLWSKWYVTQEQLGLPFAIARKSYDVVHLTGNTAPLVQAKWPPLVVTVHDVMYLKSPPATPLSLSLRQLFGRAYRAGAFLTGTIRATRLVVDSETTASDVQRLLGRHAPPVDVVYPAIDPAFKAHDAEACERVCSAHRVRPREFFIHPGAADPRKNTNTVIEAFELYVEEGGLLDLVIYGLGQAMQKRLSRALRPTSRHRIRLLAWLSDQDVVALTQSAAACLFVPSDEGFGYPMLEAMAAKTPVVASSITVLREMSAGHALWVEPRDRQALCQMLSTFDGGESRLRVVDDARTRANDFSQEQMADAIATSYERAMGRVP
jgi:glycosyltransferase involved in cell wall biosynthesis